MNGIVKGRCEIFTNMLSVEKNKKFSSHSILKSTFFQHIAKRELQQNAWTTRRNDKPELARFFSRVETRERWKMNSAHGNARCWDDFFESRAVSLGVIVRDNVSESRAWTRRVRRADRDDSLYVTSAESGRFPVRTRCPNITGLRRRRARTYTGQYVSYTLVVSHPPWLEHWVYMKEKKSIYINTLDNIY